MTSFKLKFRPSAVIGREGCLYYQIIHDRVVRQVRTGYRIFEEEWDARTKTVRLSPSATADRRHYLKSVSDSLRWDRRRLNAIVSALESRGESYAADDIVTRFARQADEQSLSGFMQGIIGRLKLLGRTRTSETYASALASFMRFRNGEDILLQELDSDTVMLYEAWMKGRGICPNTTSFYMRILRAVYNRAVERNLTEQRYPFKHVYTGIGKTVKRALPLKVIRRIKELDLTLRPRLEYARDLFLFSFYTRGMSFIDMAYLRKSDLKHGVLTYRRKKTGQQLNIQWEECMEGLVRKYEESFSTGYLLPIIRRADADERTQYINALYRVNMALKEIARLVDLSMPLTMYCARHAWASIAKSKNIPLSVISEGMGHDSEETTRIYLASLDTSMVDKANRLILKEL